MLKCKFLTSIIIFFILTTNVYAQDGIRVDFHHMEKYFYVRVEHHQLGKPANHPEIIPSYNMQDYDQVIQHIYKTILNKQIDINVRIAKTSAVFLGRPYLLGALGEGPEGEFDQEPLYRTDAFDCTTFVETVLALSEAKDFQQFNNVIKKIRYSNNAVNFIHRNHFISVDWNQANEKNGYIKDITEQFSVPYQVATTTIDKPNWYRTLPPNTIKLLHSIDQQQAQILLEKFRDNATKVNPVVSQISYLPLSELFFSQNGKLMPREQIFDQIPSASIIEIVRNNYDLTQQIGTHLDVTHVGLAIRTPLGLMFREASEFDNRIVDMPLTEYLLYYYRYARNSEHIGIHVEKIIG